MIGIQQVPLAGGVNTYLDPARVADDKMTKLENVAPRERGFPGMRPSLSFVRELIPDYRPWDSTLSDPAQVNNFYWKWAENWRPLKFLFTETTGELVALMVATNDIVVADDNGSTTTTRTVPAGTVVLIGFPGVVATGGNSGPYCAVLGDEAAHYSLLNFDGIIYAFGPGSNGARIEPSDAGTLGPLLGWNYARNEFLGSGNESFNPAGAAIIRDRTIFWKGAKVFWSDKNDPLSVPDNVETTGSIVVTSGELEPITCCAELGTSADGSPVQSVAAVWTRTSMYMLLGEPAESDAVDEGGGVIGSLQINKLNVEAGCVSQATVTRTPYGTFWVGADDVWFMPFGSLPIRVGTAIRDRLLSQPPQLSWKLCAEYDDGFLKVSMFGPGQASTGTGPLQEQWWLDLTSGPPQNADAARWFGPQTLRIDRGDSGEYGIFCMARDVRGSGDGKMYTLQPYAMYGNTEQTIYGMSLCSFLQADGVDSSAPKYSPQKWVPEAPHFEGDIWVPQGSTSTRLAPVFVCVTAGNSHATTEPDWYTSPDAITDGTAVFRPVYFADGVGVTLAVMSGRQVRESVDNSHHTPITIQTKEYTLGDPVVEKLLDGMEMAYWSRQATHLTYSTNPDQTSNARAVEAATSPAFGVTATPFVASKLWRRKFLSPQASRRFSAQSAIGRIVQTPGIIITEGYNDTFNFFYGSGAAECTIAAGYYATLRDVWNAMKAAQLANVAFEVSLTSVFDEDGGPLRCRFGVKDESGALHLTLPYVNEYPLMQMFGFTPAQVGQTNFNNPTQYLFTKQEYAYTLCPDIQLSALNIRFAAFGRRAT